MKTAPHIVEQTFPINRADGVERFSVVSVDLLAIAIALSHRAERSKSGKAKYMHGAVVVRVVEGDKA